ncbi:MAG: alpha/beta hydrolase [bacterium]|nr:alpha/beta hydrolase [bacterium]
MKYLKIFSILPIVYILIATFFITFQRKLIYHPPKPIASIPTNYDIPYEPVTIKTSDDLNLSAWWMPQKESTTSATLLYCHGNGADLSHLSHVTKVFYGYGLNTLFFDYRSYGKSDLGKLTENSIAIDAEAAFQWLLSKGIPENKIIIWGHSLGSSVAARLAANHDVAGLILEGAFPSMFLMGQERYPWLPLAEFMILDKFDTASYLSTRSTPLLMTHAENDTVIPIKFGMQAFEKASEPKEWLVIKGIDHSDFPMVEKFYKDQIMEFINKSLSTAQLNNVKTTEQ